MEGSYNEVKPFYLAHNGLDVFHYGELSEGQVIITGQPFLEFFKTKSAQELRLKQLGYEIPD